MLERDVEKYLRLQIESIGGRCLKWVCPQVSGVPDRIVLIKGKIYFVETKRPTDGIWAKLQIIFAKWLVKNGFDFSLIQSIAEVDFFINRIKQETSIEQL